MKIISQAALVLIVVFSLLLVVSNGGIKDTCKMYSADGADMGITYDGCVASLAKMAYREPQITAMVVMIGPLFHTWFLAVGLGALYSLFSLEAGTKEVAVAHLTHASFMTVAGLMHMNNGGLISLGFWPASPHVTAEAKAILPPWAIMCSTVGAVCWAAFFVSAGKESGKAKTA